MENENSNLFLFSYILSVYILFSRFDVSYTNERCSIRPFGTVTLQKGLSKGGKGTRTFRIRKRAKAKERDAKKNGSQKGTGRKRGISAHERLRQIFSYEFFSFFLCMRARILSPKRNFSRSRNVEIFRASRSITNVQIWTFTETNVVSIVWRFWFLNAGD